MNDLWQVEDAEGRPLMALLPDAMAAAAQGDSASDEASRKTSSSSGSQGGAEQRDDELAAEARGCAFVPFVDTR